MWGFGGKRTKVLKMKVILTEGTRKGQTVDLPEADAKKLIKKGHAKSTAKKSTAKKASKKSE